MQDVGAGVEMKKAAHDRKVKGLGKLLLQLYSQVGGDTGRNTSFSTPWAPRVENGPRGEKEVIMLGDLKAPFSSHIALFQEHEREGGGKGAPGMGVP